MLQYNEDINVRNPYFSKRNLDNYPTHKIYQDNGEVLEYCAASKNFKHVDPTISDRRNYHYASEDRVYLLLKNKASGDWEFPTQKILLSESFARAKQNLFERIMAG